MANEKKVITKKDWVSSFTLTGKPVINDYTFKIDEKSTSSNWIYNSLNLGVDCGETHGTVYCEMMGGYSEENAGLIYVHGKKKGDDGKDTDDFDNRFTIDWEDRHNPEILKTIGDLCFITVSLEKTSKGLFRKRFLSEYDAVAYINEYLRDDMIITVRGNLKYSEYQGNVQVRKNITNIYVNNKIEDASEFFAHFTQSILIDSESASLKNIDKDKGVMYVDAKVLDYLKEKDGIEIKGQYPYNKQFEFKMDLTNQSLCTNIVNKLFKVKNGYTQITFEGDLIEGGAVVAATWEDIPQDIKDLVECGIYTKEDALARCTSNGNREQRMVLEKPMIRLVGEDKTPIVQKFDERYTDDDLILDYLYENDEADDELPFDPDNKTKSTDVGELDWLSKL